MRYFCRFRYAASFCPVSRVRRVRSSLGRGDPESAFMKHLEETSEWSHSFWHKNNTRFDHFMASEGHNEDAYREYLLKHKQEFIEYNREWYSRNVKLLWLDVKVKLHYTLKALAFI